MYAIFQQLKYANMRTKKKKKTLTQSPVNKDRQVSTLEGSEIKIRIVSLHAMAVDSNA